MPQIDQQGAGTMSDRQNYVGLYLFAAFLVSQVLAFWLSTFYVAPSLGLIRFTTAYLLSFLWVAVYFSLFRKGYKKSRNAVFVILTIASIILGFFISGNHEVFNCEIARVVDKKTILYNCELSGSGTGTFRATIDSPVMELLDFY
jgi:hypothetical protein